MTLNLFNSITLVAIISASSFQPESRIISVNQNDDASGSDSSHRRFPAAIQQGDVIFGGLFPIHDKGDGDGKCGVLNTETGFQRLLAMIYAVDKLNKEDIVLPGIKIGFHLHDTCQNDIYAMERVLEFIAMRSEWIRNMEEEESNDVDLSKKTAQYSSQKAYANTRFMRKDEPIWRKPIVAVIGPALSSITTAVASVFRLFHIPQISYAATSTELSDRSRFSYFFRVVPPDNLQAEVVAAVVHALKWNYMWAVGDEGAYGYNGIKSLRAALDDHICIADELFIPRNADDEFYEKLIEKLSSNTRTRGVVLFCNELNIRRLLLATVRKNMSNHFYWLASDSWGAKQRLVQGVEETADAAITILPQKEIITDFDVYMRGLKFDCNRHDSRIPWLHEYWETVNNCSCNPGATGLRQCPDSKDKLPIYHQEGLIQFVIDSVNAVAHALRNIQRIYCGETYIGMCVNMQRVIYNGTLVRDFIRNVSFFGISKNHITFNSQGGVEGKYEVYQFRMKTTGPSYEYIKTGWWNPVNGLALHQPHDRGFELTTFCARGSHSEPMPVSYCSDACDVGFGYEYATDLKCCWHCERCHKNQFLNKTSLVCDVCPAGQLQSAYRVDQCEPKRFVHIDWSTVWPCIPIALSAIGLVANILVFYVLIRFNKTAVIKAAGRESSMILLTGLTMTFSTIILQLLWPSALSCTIMRLGLPISLTMCYASIFTKTHRLYRIFLPSLSNLIHRPPFISPQSQVIMTLLCTGVSLLISIVCLTLEPPTVEYLEHNLPETIVRCRIKNTTFFLTFIYDILVIVATTSLAWQVRNIPENFNEAKYIAFLMITSCVVWIGLMPIYFLVTSNYTVQMTSFLLCITLSAINIQVCMFMPKLYVVFTGNEDLLRRGHHRHDNKFAFATANLKYGVGSTPCILPKAMEVATSPPIQSSVKDETAETVVSPVPQQQACEKQPLLHTPANHLEPRRRSFDRRSSTRSLDSKNSLNESAELKRKWSRRSHHSGSVDEAVIIPNGMVTTKPPVSKSTLQVNDSKRVSGSKRHSSINPLVMAMTPIFSPLPAHNVITSIDDGSASTSNGSNTSSVDEFAEMSYRQRLAYREHDRTSAKQLAKALKRNKKAADRQPKLPVNDTLLMLSNQTATRHSLQPSSASVAHSRSPNSSTYSKKKHSFARHLSIAASSDSAGSSKSPVSRHKLLALTKKHTLFRSIDDQHLACSTSTPSLEDATNQRLSASTQRSVAPGWVTGDVTTV